jgi:RND family efflux transporter MFP subunit
MISAQRTSSIAATLGVVWAALALLSVTLVAACDQDDAQPAPEIRPVRTVTVERRADNTTVSLTGTVQAETEVNLAFRIDGRMTERTINVGDTVTPGQVIARLDRQNEENGVRSARASVAAAMGQLAEARNNHRRQSELLASGFTTRVRYDQAAQLLQTAQSQADSAHAQLANAENRLTYTDLVVDAGGVVTARGAEPGEVVQAGRMIVQIARQDGRDAVFDVPARMFSLEAADPHVRVALTTDPAVTAVGRVREVAPRADPVTGTFQVRVGLADPPTAMRLGSTVTGRVEVASAASIEVPATALTRNERWPAVWVVDPQSATVALRNIEVERYDPLHVIVAQGLEPGDVVVTAGAQALRPGQRVRLLGASPR